jgi:Ca2+-binding RTX toxin-like protein
MAVAALLCASAGTALGVARVGLNGGALAVAVDPGAGAGDSHGLIVEPFTDVTRDGFRARQDALGRPTITTSDGDCAANPVFNDVVCTGSRGSLSLVMGAGGDTVSLRGPNASAETCFGGGGNAPTVPATIDLGAGDDFLAVQNCAPGTAISNQVAWRVTADGGPGADSVWGGTLDDTLLGGSGPNDLKGREGDDLLRGGDERDSLDGEAGDDTLRGGDGLDGFSGGAGNDLFHGGLNGGGPDAFVGGPGIDTVTYALAGSVTVTIFDPANPNANGPDGRAGENDAVQGDVENVTGSGNDDALTGNNLANRLDGSLGADAITGAGGADTLLGGDGNDALNSRDGLPDPTIDCGPGAADTATIDLVDRTPRRPANCERVDFFATDDGPPGRLAAAALRPNAAGVARARLTCPRNARIACRGTLRLRRPAPPRRILGRAAYDVARGSGEAIAIRVPASLRGRRALLETRERGVSRKGPRGVAVVVRVR